MRLKYLQLVNFRQFFGETPKIEFAHGTQNVTVIHGMNGSGKTAFLNAFTWVLYGAFSKGFRNTDQLINKRAIAETPIGKRVECSVELGFEHGGLSYRIKRVVDAIITEGSEYPAVRTKEYLLWFLDHDDQWKRAHDVESTIGRILPSDLHSYFFFDGERVERIVDPRKDDRATLARAVKTLLGLEIIERSIRHLKRAKRRFEDEIAKYGSSETKRLIEQKELLASKAEALEAKIANLQQNIDDQSENLSNLMQRMRKLDTVRHLQVRRDELQESIKKTKDTLRTNQHLVRAKISDNAYILHTTEFGNSFIELIADLKRKGELPAGIKKDFAKKLLGSGLCICGRSIEHNADSACKAARKKIEDWLEAAGLQDVEDAALELGAKVATWPELRRDVRVRLEELTGQAKSALDDIAHEEASLQKIRRELEGSPLEDVRSLETKIAAEEKIKTDYVEDFAISKRALKELEEQLESADAELDKVEAKNAKQLLAKRRRDATDEVVKAMAQILELMDQKWRTSLERRIQEIFREISVKPYVPKLNRDYSIVLEDPTSSGDVAFSQGESLVLSFSFIAAIIDEARMASAQKNEMKGPDSSQYPLVMDSPFGALDETNRSHVSSKISQLADQVVVMVSKTQWREEVDQAMAPKTGRSWVLTYHNPREDTLISEIRIGSRTFPLMKRSADEFEYTTIEDANNA